MHALVLLCVNQHTIFEVPSFKSAIDSGIWVPAIYYNIRYLRYIAHSPHHYRPPMSDGHPHPFVSQEVQLKPCAGANIP